MTFDDSVHRVSRKSHDTDKRFLVQEHFVQHGWAVRIAEDVVAYGRSFVQHIGETIGYTFLDSLLELGIAITKRLLGIGVEVVGHLLPLFSGLGFGLGLCIGFCLGLGIVCIDLGHALVNTSLCQIVDKFIVAIEVVARLDWLFLGHGLLDFVNLALELLAKFFALCIKLGLVLFLHLAKLTLEGMLRFLFLGELGKVWLGLRFGWLVLGWLRLFLGRLVLRRSFLCRLIVFGRLRFFGWLRPVLRRFVRPFLGLVLGWCFFDNSSLSSGWLFILDFVHYRFGKAHGSLLVSLNLSYEVSKLSSTHSRLRTCGLRISQSWHRIVQCCDCCQCNLSI